jgi:hypothetical protein
LPAPDREYPLSLPTLLAELPFRVRAVVDVSVFARLSAAHRLAVQCLAAALGTHVVAYAPHAAGPGLPLCAAVGQTRLDQGEIAALQAVERELPPGTVLVAYARPAEPRLSEEALLRAASLNT